MGFVAAHCGTLFVFCPVYSLFVVFLDLAGIVTTFLGKGELVGFALGLCV